MATSEEVAQLAGVSRATVSRALNGSARVGDMNLMSLPRAWFANAPM
jgi:transcriptional regulator with XRE-family HTH domain